jgi:hypothetical protein
MKISDTPAPYGTPRKPGIALDFTGNLGSVIDLPAEALAKAVRNVASHAHDTADARLLLETLGPIQPAETTPAEVVSDCEPTMPRTVPFAFEVDVHTATLDGRFIANVPTGGLL